MAASTYASAFLRRVGCGPSYYNPGEYEGMVLCGGLEHEFRTFGDKDEQVDYYIDWEPRKPSPDPWVHEGTRGVIARAARRDLRKLRAQLIEELGMEGYKEHPRYQEVEFEGAEYDKENEGIETDGEPLEVIENWFGGDSIIEVDDHKEQKRSENQNTGSQDDATDDPEVVFTEDQAEEDVVLVDLLYDRKTSASATVDDDTASECALSDAESDDCSCGLDDSFYVDIDNGELETANNGASRVAPSTIITPPRKMWKTLSRCTPFVNLGHYRYLTHEVRA